MKNLTTRKIVLGLLMVLVLAFGVQGITDALTFSASTTNSNPADSGNLSWMNVGDMITVSVTSISINQSSPIDFTKVKEAITVSVSGGGAEFPIGNSDVSSHTWTEEPSGDTQTNINTVITNGFDVVVTVNSPGKVIVKVSDASSGGGITATNKAKTLAFTFYVVEHRLDVGSTEKISLLGLTNGVGSGYDSRQPVQIHTADNKNNPVNFTIAGGGSLYVREGTVDGAEQSSTLTTSSSANVWMSMGTDNDNAANSNTVTAQVANNDIIQGIYIYGRPTLMVTTSSDPLTGSRGQTFASAITVVVNDEDDDGSPGGPVIGVPVKFDVADKSVTGAYLIPPETEKTSPPVVTSTNSLIMNSNDIPSSARTLYVRTKDTGAVVNLELGTAAGKSDITVSSAGKNFTLSKRVEVTVTGEDTTTLSESENRRRSSNSKLFDLVALVEENGIGKSGVVVTFRTGRGTLTSTPANGSETDSTEDNSAGDTLIPNTGRIIKETTDTAGRAHVIYNIGDNTGRQEIDASINDDNTNLRQEITFIVNGPAGSGDDQRDDSDTPTRILDIDVSGSGNTRDVTVTALQNGVPQTGISVDLTVSGAATLTRESGGTPLESTLTLPTTAGTYTLRASTTATGYSAVTEDVEVTLPGTLLLEEIGARAATGGQSIRVTVREADGTLASGDVPVTLSGAVSRTVPTTDGTGTGVITLPTTGGPYTVTLTATDYTPSSYTFTTTGQPTTPTTPTTTGPAGEADSIEIDGQRQRSATVNRATSLRAQVLDANNRGVRDVRVTFKVLAPGKGRLSQRGNGLAIQIRTDRNGYATASLTPLGGDLIVEAKAAGVTAPVTFIINVGEASDDPETPAPGTGDTPRTEINPADAEVHISAANRPPMLWVDNGKIYALVSAEVQEFVKMKETPATDEVMAGEVEVKNVRNIAIGGGKVYWTEQAGESSGTINSANLDGSNAIELKSIKAVPMGITVDTDAEKLYWTNSRGRIQSADLDGSGIENVLLDLTDPKDIAVARGNVYWTQYDATESAGAVGIVNPTAQGAPRYISTGSDMPESLVIGGNKVYWTEMTGTSSGTINSANLSGNNDTQLASIRAVPMGIAVDNARSKLFWTNSRGRIQSADLNGKKIQNVVDGLGMPGDMVLSNSIAAPAAAPTPSPTASKSKYDINRDGTVDSTDAGLIVLAISTGDTNDRLDVNGDGKVNFSDYVLVTENFTEDAAAAPTLLGVKMTTVQIDRLQEQIDLLIASGDRSPATMRALIYFQQLIAMARPEKTQLLANYPNPFNPETWIPYELATDTNVRITIYNTHGVVIRTLALGHQSAGYYTGRDRAAYWDGRNALGEQVASGIYFYQFETDDLSSMRKMVILK